MFPSRSQTVVPKLISGELKNRSGHKEKFYLGGKEKLFRMDHQPHQKSCLIFLGCGSAIGPFLSFATDTERKFQLACCCEGKGGCCAGSEMVHIYSLTDSLSRHSAIPNSARMYIPEVWRSIHGQIRP